MSKILNYLKYTLHLDILLDHIPRIMHQYDLSSKINLRTPNLQGNCLVNSNNVKQDHY